MNYIVLQIKKYIKQICRYLTNLKKNSLFLNDKNNELHNGLLILENKWKRINLRRLLIFKKNAFGAKFYVFLTKCM